MLGARRVSWDSIGTWWLRRFYPWYVPPALRSALQRELSKANAILHERTSGYDAAAWSHLTVALLRTAPITGFADFIETILYELEIAGVVFPARSTAASVVRCGGGWGGYIRLDGLGRVLGPLDVWLVERAQRTAEEQAEAALDAFVFDELQCADEAASEANKAVAELELRTDEAANAVTKARSISREVSARRDVVESNLDELHAAESENEPDAKGAKRAARIRRLERELLDLRARQDAAEEASAGAFTALSVARAHVNYQLGDQIVTAARARVRDEAAYAGLDVDEVMRRLGKLHYWHLSTAREHAEKGTLVARAERQMALIAELKTAGGTADR